MELKDSHRPVPIDGNFWEVKVDFGDHRAAELRCTQNHSGQNGGRQQEGYFKGSVHSDVGDSTTELLSSRQRTGLVDQQHIKSHKSKCPFNNNVISSCMRENHYNLLQFSIVYLDILTDS